MAHPLDGSLFFRILIALKTKEIHNKFTKVLNEKFDGDVMLLLDDLERFAIENGEQYEIADKILKLKAMGFGKYKTVGCGSAGFDGVTILCVKCNRY